MTDEKIIGMVNELTEDSVRVEVNIVRFIKEVFEPLSKYARDEQDLGLSEFIIDAIAGADAFLKCERELLQGMVYNATKIAGMTNDEIKAMGKAPAPRRKAGAVGVVMAYDPVAKKMVKVSEDDIPDEMLEILKHLEDSE